ncbi:hypothetical protein T484DRAFT_1823014 [Baffinella frigidus]|nr:hypothetical protein T484DRAFT_1823014 [Cryptophyta sp. CCMP2293]
MAAGDGMADIVGRKYGSVKWPWDKDKSLVGSLAFVAGAFAATWGILAWFSAFGLLTLPASAAPDVSGPPPEAT